MNFPQVTRYQPAQSAGTDRVRSSRPSVPASLSNVACALRAPLMLFLCLFNFAFLILPSARGAQMRFGPYTNYDGTPITNTILLVRPVGNPAIDANGNVTAAIGLPTRITLGPDGLWTNTLQNQNYQVTNSLGVPAFFNKGYYFRAPFDTGPTIYSTTAPGIFITGADYFVTLVGGTNGGSVTFNSITNGLGYAPLAPADTNGFVRLLQITNVTIGAMPANFWSANATAWISNLISFGTLTTNRYAAGALMSATTNTAGVVTFAGAVQTNGFTSIVGSNANTFMATNLLPALTNLFVRADITNNAATRAELISATNGIAGNVGISAATATNINNNSTGVIATNGTSLTYKFSGTGTNAIIAIAAPLTNGFVDKSITNNAATVAQLNQKANTNGPTIYSATVMGGIVQGASRFKATNASVGDFIADYDTDAEDLFIIRHNGSEFFLGITNGGQQSFIDFNVGGESEFNLPAGQFYRFYVRGPTGVDTNVFSIGDAGASGNGGGVSNTWTTNLTGPALVQSTNIAKFFTNGLIHFIDATNVATGAVVTKLDRVSGIANGLIATNNLFIGAGNGQSYLSNYMSSSSANIDWNFWNAGAGEFDTIVSAGMGGITFQLAPKITTAAASTVAVFDGSQKLGSLANAAGNLTNNGTGGFGYDSVARATVAQLISATNAIAAGSGISASTGTNIANSQIGLSNAIVNANKLDKTNGTSYGLVATNTALEGNVSFGSTGQATNILGSNPTNYVRLLGAGESSATNGTFVWISALNLLTNFVSGDTITNNSSAFLVISNGVPLYSAPTLFGTYTAINGVSPVPTAVGTALINSDGFAWSGAVSPTNINYQIANAISRATNSLNTLITNGLATGSIAASNGFGTKTTLINATALTWSGLFHGLMNFQVMNAGYSNSVDASAQSAALSGGYNIIDDAGTGNLIAGGMSNHIGGTINSIFNFIGGGFSNLITGQPGAHVIVGGQFNINDAGGFGSFIGGGSGNKITFISGGNGGFSTILGGATNTIRAAAFGQPLYSTIIGGISNLLYAPYDVVSGRNVTVSNIDVFAWSGGPALTSTTNSQALLAATNGLYLNGPLRLDALSTNGGIYVLSNQFSLFAVTNNMPNFAHWYGPSNGLPVIIWNSNGVPVMKNLWP